MIENPFFRREVRQFARRKPVAWKCAGVALGTMAIVLLGAASFGAALDEIRLLGLLVIPHIALCALATFYGMSRVFWAEGQNGALEMVLLLPMRALRWLLLKL